MINKSIYIFFLAGVLLLAYGLPSAAHAQEPMRFLPRSETHIRFDRSDRSPSVELQFSRAERAWKSGGSLLEAKVRLDLVLNSAPNDVPALLLRSKVLAALDRPEQALRDAEQAVELRSKSGEAWLALAEAARLAGDELRAREALEEAAQNAFTDAAMHVRLSWNAQALDQSRRAEAYARTALALDPSLPATYYQLARVFIQRKQKDAAVTILTRGFQAELLSPEAIMDDSILDVLAAHPTLAPYFR